MDKLDYNKIYVCSSKDTAKKIKRLATDWEKIFADIYLIKALYPNIHRTLSIQWDKKKKNNNHEQWNWHFNKEDIRMANKIEKDVY